ncbi:MAG: hypothetical protein A2750_00295 [Candidatus Yanofskybacteria bacterium RIFCSPHIGHO2_01_FULL_45_42]|uniref:Uncharacterized protein n=3 Tax=Candidatus Yanofskyibacteriota TaxID=1752733 RepID=A0A1F8F5E2_9BACT|nr:MAG: hypothetical protein A2750_00295 [Candidatus Yanofskybacteria bacterium RIFCSPHIGHO2_01_FULL_45_42]OGN15835.1 MAG: hypothetical protein A3C81_01950 [Candidatus Yanofskybacteria bacterium RIFCSPHIGHO2_02_FULL_46_19]OGN26044.1 MAG: hypothetical protein A3B17_02540 [Candidatus Yanofskybacteria bacterium RIFCSPLOWO2_01_FULL_45_72]OGN32273.1 MAG: hypothetical protein A3J01_02315 [Candidatus Yanofskybacteria bacterium RIFCSPLOWO2_02_FULL_45_18]
MSIFKKIWAKLTSTDVETIQPSGNNLPLLMPNPETYFKPEEGEVAESAEKQIELEGKTGNATGNTGEKETEEYIKKLQN